jgi:Amt family ammonium transporter
MGALAIGLASGVLCFFGATTLKRKLGYDDSLDAFGVHGIGGIVGAILTGVFAADTLGGTGFKVAEKSIMAQVGVQAYGVIATIIYTAIATFIILKVIDVIMGLRVSEDQEVEGLDITLHDEKGYNL